jgi:hypothetical protein
VETGLYIVNTSLIGVTALATVVYMAVTGRILTWNKKSAEAAKGQVEQMKSQQKSALLVNQQQVALQLLDKRLASLGCLEEWVLLAQRFRDRRQWHKDGRQEAFVLPNGLLPSVSCGSSEELHWDDWIT